MAPEVFRNAHRADIRADIYSLGCTLYRFLTGQVPFPEGSAEDKLLAHRQRLPQLVTALCPDLPGQLAPVVARMMAKDPAQRYQSPAEVAQLLVPFISGCAPRVLVIDDNPAIRESIRVVLEGSGYQVTVAEDGQQGLDYLRGGLRPGVILLDLLMPVMDGWQFLREIRQDAELTLIPTVIITAADEAQAKEVARGAAGYLQKPVNLQDVASFVRRYTV
jgi:CheY-like chemotaxis protein